MLNPPPAKFACQRGRSRRRLGNFFSPRPSSSQLCCCLFALHFSGASMNALCPGLSRCVVGLLIGLLLFPSLAVAAPKPLDPATVHARVLKRGPGKWICIREANGVELVGRILQIRDRSFLLQLPNDPDPVEVFYASVTYLRTGFG